MNYDKFTEKSREALGVAQQIAATMNHQELTDLHLLAALLKDSDGMASALLQKMKQDPKQVNQEIDQALARIPQVTGDGVTQVYMGRDGAKILQVAEEKAGQLKDEYISVEHLLYGIVSKGREAAAILMRHGVSDDSLMQALQSVRGNQRVTSADAGS